MFAFILVAVLVGGGAHSYLLRDRTTARVGELFLRWILVGYCGLPMLVVSVMALAAPERLAEHLPVGPPGIMLAFFGWAYLGMSLMALMALRYRGVFLVGPAVCWAVYFAGANIVHTQGSAASGSHSHGSILATFATHGGIALALTAALLASGLLKRSDARSLDAERG